MRDAAPRVQPTVQPHLPPPGPATPAAAQPVGVQSSAPSALVEGAAPRLLADTEAALARIGLHQIASMPDDQRPAKADSPEARWSCEIPILVDGRTAIMGFVVERDGRHGAPEGEPRRWRVQAALDLPETGPVHADVRLRGMHVVAGLLAERGEIADVLAAALPQLRDGLTAAGFEVEALSVRHGRPEPRPEPPGRYLDARS